MPAEQQHQVRVVEGVPPELAAALAALPKDEGRIDVQFLERQVSGRPRVLSCIAEVDGQLAGYKIGYEERRHYFESWIGAVLPAYRRRGIARDLMAAQHAWCREQGYRIVSTITQGDNRAMLIANLEAGFEVVGTFLDRRKILKVMLQKHLQE